MEARCYLSALGGAGALGIRRGAVSVLSARIMDLGRGAGRDPAVEGGSLGVLLARVTLAGATDALARRWLAPPDATFAAAFYAINPYHLVIVYWRSAYAELLAAIVVPLVLLGATSQRRR